MTPLLLLPLRHPAIRENPNYSQHISSGDGWVCRSCGVLLRLPPLVLLAFSIFRFISTRIFLNVGGFQSVSHGVQRPSRWL